MMWLPYGLTAILVLSVTVADAAEPAAAPKIRVYQVADLAAREAVHAAGPAIVERTREDLQKEHEETLAALKRLADLVEEMVPSAGGAIGIQPETLSLVVRRSPAEHEEIAALFEELRQESDATLELTAKLLVEGNSEDPAAQAALEELGARYLLQFGSQNGMSPAEVERVLETMRKTGGHLIDLPKFRLRNGFRTTWGTSIRPLSVTALTDAAQDRITLRIDARMNDPANGPVKVRTSKLELKVGHSFLYQVQADDGDEGLYLVTIRRPGETQTPVTAAAEPAARK